MRDINKPIGVSEFQFAEALPEEMKSSLPTIEEIENELKNLEQHHQLIPLPTVLVLWYPRITVLDRLRLTNKFYTPYRQFANIQASKTLQ